MESSECTKKIFGLDTFWNEISNQQIGIYGFCHENGYVQGFCISKRCHMSFQCELFDIWCQ